MTIDYTVHNYLSEYLDLTFKTAVYPIEVENFYLALGISNEVGELQDARSDTENLMKRAA